MIQKVFKITELKDTNSVEDNRKFWLRKSPEERVATVDFLRAQYHGSTARFQRIAKVIQRIQS